MKRFLSFILSAVMLLSLIPAMSFATQDTMTDAQKDALLALGAYVAVTKDGATEYSYMQDETKGELIGSYYFVSYNDIV